MSNNSSFLHTSLEELYAVQVNDGRVITSGMLSQNQFAQLTEAGIELVINLMPDDNNKEYQNEAELVKENGMGYVYIPVDWSKPSVENVKQFFDIMRTHQDKKILLHCLVNFRASAFYYLYMLTQINMKNIENNIENDSIDIIDMHKIMQPWGDLTQSFEKYPQWQALIEQVTDMYSNK